MGMLRRTPKSRHVIRRSACLSQHFRLTKTGPQTTRCDRRARSAGMGNELQHDVQIATIAITVEELQASTKLDLARQAGLLPSRVDIHKILTHWKMPLHT